MCEQASIRNVAILDGHVQALMRVIYQEAKNFLPRLNKERAM